MCRFDAQVGCSRYHLIVADVPRERTLFYHFSADQNLENKCDFKIELKPIQDMYFKFNLRSVYCTEGTVQNQTICFGITKGNKLLSWIMCEEGGFMDYRIWRWKHVNSVIALSKGICYIHVGNEIRIIKVVKGIISSKSTLHCTLIQNAKSVVFRDPGFCCLFDDKLYVCYQKRWYYMHSFERGDAHLVSSGDKVFILHNSNITDIYEVTNNKVKLYYSKKDHYTDKVVSDGSSSYIIVPKTAMEHDIHIKDFSYKNKPECLSLQGCKPTHMCSVPSQSKYMVFVIVSSKKCGMLYMINKDKQFIKLAKLGRHKQEQLN